MSETDVMQSAAPLVLEQAVNASVERVFAAWTQPEQIAQWYGPETMRVGEHAFDVRVGGAYRVAFEGENGTFVLSGAYTDVSPPNRIGFTWAWVDDNGDRGPESNVMVEIEAVSEGALVRITHTALPDAEARNEHAKGWGSMLKSLAGFIAWE